MKNHICKTLLKIEPLLEWMVPSDGNWITYSSVKRKRSWSKGDEPKGSASSCSIHSKRWCSRMWSGCRSCKCCSSLEDTCHLFTMEESFNCTLRLQGSDRLGTNTTYCVSPIKTVIRSILFHGDTVWFPAIDETKHRRKNSADRYGKFDASCNAIRLTQERRSRKRQNTKLYTILGRWGLRHYCPGS